MLRDIQAGQAPLAHCWLSYYAGSEQDGIWVPALNLDPERLARIIHKLHDHQIDDLAERALFRSPLHRATPEDCFRCLGRDPSGARINYDPILGRASYTLPSGQSLFLRPGEVEILLDDGYPKTLNALFGLLWRRIAPREPLSSTFWWELQRANFQLDTIRHLLQRPDASPAELLTDVRALLQATPASHWDGLRRRHARDRFVHIVQEVINGKKFADLIDAVAELQAAEETPEV
jgi:hypothetical protein